MKGYAGGFSGYMREQSVYNSYALGNVTGGDNSYVAGFIAYAWNNYTKRYQSADGLWHVYSYNDNINLYGISMNIENCYSAGSVKGGKASTVAGFFGFRQYDYSYITFKKCYWNQSANQVLDSSYRSNAQKIANGNVTTRAVVGTYQDYMQTSNFVSDLNEYVH